MNLPWGTCWNLAKLCLLDNFPMLGEISRPGEGPNFYCSLEEEIPLYTGYLIFTSGQIVALGQVLTAGKISPEGPNFDCWRVFPAPLDWRLERRFPLLQQRPPWRKHYRATILPGFPPPYHTIISSVPYFLYTTIPTPCTTLHFCSAQYFQYLNNI